MDSRSEARKTSPAGRKLLKTTEKDTFLVLKGFFGYCVLFSFCDTIVVYRDM